VLLLPDADQRMVVYSAAPGTEAAGKLDMLRVVGLQAMAAGGGAAGEQRRATAAGVSASP
jgi:hypothetical protein